MQPSNQEIALAILHGTQREERAKNQHNVREAQDASQQTAGAGASKLTFFAGFLTAMFKVESPRVTAPRRVAAGATAAKASRVTPQMRAAATIEQQCQHWPRTSIIAAFFQHA